VSNVSSSCRAALAASSTSLADKTAALQARLDDTLSTFDSIMEGTAELQVEVTDEVGLWVCRSLQTVSVLFAQWIGVLSSLCMCGGLVES
jgi:hypothetical protein